VGTRSRKPSTLVIFPASSRVTTSKPTTGASPTTLLSSGPVDGHHGQARFTWALGPDDSNVVGEAPVVGFDVVTLDDAGKITSVLGFLDRVPTAA